MAPTNLPRDVSVASSESLIGSGTNVHDFPSCARYSVPSLPWTTRTGAACASAVTATAATRTNTPIAPRPRKKIWLGIWHDLDSARDPPTARAVYVASRPAQLDPGQLTP